MLHELYGNEGRVLPKQGIEVPDDERLRAGNVLVLKRPGCQ
jgi:hypothetical protein